MNNITVNAREFDSAVRFAEKGALRDESRTLHHIALEVDGDDLLVIGCDGFRLHGGRVDIQDSHIDPNAPVDHSKSRAQWFMDARDALAGIRAFKKSFKPKKGDLMTLMLGDMGLTILKNGKGSVTVPKDNYGTGSRGARYTDITYPDWRQIMPVDECRMVVVDVGQLQPILKEIVAEGKANKKAIPVAWIREDCHTGTLAVRTQRPHHRREKVYSYRESEYRMEVVEYSRAQFRDVVGSVSFTADPGEKRVDLCVDARYLLDALSGMDGVATIEVRDRVYGQPVVVRDDKGNLGIVMPVKKWEVTGLKRYKDKKVGED